MNELFILLKKTQKEANDLFRTKWEGKGGTARHMGYLRAQGRVNGMFEALAILGAVDVFHSWSKEQDIKAMEANR